MKSLSFTVYGVAQPQGSARAFMPKGWKRPIITSDNPKNKGWRQLVAEAASDTIARTHHPGQFIGPVRLMVSFFLPRPKSLGKKAAFHTKRPDCDKLLRSVFDALTRVVWQDDAQVVKVEATKAYVNLGEPPGAIITIASIDDFELR